MSDTVFDVKHEIAGGEPSAADVRAARLWNLPGLVSPFANAGMLRTAPPALRWFGLGAGVVLTGAAWWFWRRGHAVLPASLLAAHAALALAGIVNPRLPEAAARAWIAFGEVLGKVMAYPIFGGLYFLVVTPIALLVRMTSGDPLRRAARGDAPTFWVRREPATRERFERQF